ncbi:class I SAM-dependent methyltransferase [Halococcus sediminicola]|uniref:class I SAM-dependent methyltransferase n=1 Tax=Halococcus sediminicola TaxID=1264579 RepID=UPI00067970F3|nr:class I SAM-dependent methyltransferase [Halococcus sediminicola]
MATNTRIPLLERSQQVYDWWGKNRFLYRIISKVNEVPRQRASARLGLTGGETILEVGCGPGVNFPLLRDAVGTDGKVVGIDISSGMVQRATQRQQKQGWSNVQPICGDATRMPVKEDSYDAAFASLALSVIPDVRDVIETVYDVLKPGGRFVVYDSAGRYQEGFPRLLNPLHRRFVRYMFNHQLDQDVVEELRTVFEIVDVVETFKSGSEYVAVATKSPTLPE